MKENFEFKQINELCAKCYRFASILMIFSFLFNNVFHIFSVNPTIMKISFILVMILLWIPTFIINILKISNEYTPYIISTIGIYCVSILYFLLNYHTILLLAFPLLVICLYFNDNLSRYTFIMSLICMFLAHLGECYISYIPTRPLKTPFQIIIWGYMPRMIELSCLYLISQRIVKRNKELLQWVKNQAVKNFKIQQDMIIQFSAICENSSSQTGKHIKRTSEYVKILALGAGLDDETAEKVSLASMMHDIGKIKIDDKILDKEGKLTEEEFEIIKKHTEYGEQLLDNNDGEIMKIAKVIAKQHHEKWDGTGYYNMKGNDIDFYARLMSVADVFDALVSKRSYKEPWAEQDAYNEIIKLSGTHFDPYVVEIFKDNYDKILKIYNKYKE